ncbi:unnamed protein product, partial [Symbiodinium necroappetens]
MVKTSLWHSASSSIGLTWSVAMTVAYRISSQGHGWPTVFIWLFPVVAPCSCCFGLVADTLVEGARHDDVRQRRRVYHLTSQEDVGAPLCMVRRQGGGAAGVLAGLQAFSSQSSMVPPLKCTILTRWQAEARFESILEALEAGLEKLSTEKGPDSSNPYSREEHRLFLSWLPEEDRKFLEDSDGPAESHRTKPATMGGGSSIPKGNLAQRGVSAVAGGIDSLTGSESGSGIASKAVDKLGIGKPKTGPAWRLQSWDIHARDKCEPWLIGYALGKFRGANQEAQRLVFRLLPGPYWSLLQRLDQLAEPLAIRTAKGERPTNDDIRRLANVMYETDQIKRGSMWDTDMTDQGARMWGELAHDEALRI